MLLAKVENNIIVELIDTDSPELFPDYIEVPEHLPSNADLRFYHADFTPKTTEELIAEGLIEPEPEPGPEPNEPEPEPEPEPGPPTKQELSGYVAQKRYEKEVGGTIWNGWPVHTDRESQSKIVAERLAIEAGERTDPDGWKFADGGFRMVSNADFVGLASAVRQHVRDCFALEAAILVQIETGTITEYSQIDAALGLTPEQIDTMWQGAQSL